MDGLLIGPGSLVGQPDAMSEALDCDLKFTSSGTTEGDLWYAYSGTTVKYYLNGDSARTDETLAHNREACLQTIVESDSNETIKFYWKVSSESGGDYLQFYIDSTLKDQISGEVGWQQKSYSVTAGTHTLKWRYVKNSSGESGDDVGWVDFVQWTGPSPAQDPSNWAVPGGSLTGEIAYKHDVGGRRVEKKVDGYSTRYVYDGPHVIAEYDGNNNLLRKYIFGPGIDQPVSMIEVADSNAVYYYHFDALGSVVALSNAAGDTVQTYEYSVYGEVAVEDANHTNPYMFAGVRYDIEIGLYYNRARYYNPFTGRFLQTDPIGYGAGMNLYAYCRNSPVILTDPSGLEPNDFNDTNDLNDVSDQDFADFNDFNDFEDSDEPDNMLGAGGLPGGAGMAVLALTISMIAATPDYSTADDGLMAYAKMMEGWKWRPAASQATRWQRFTSMLKVRGNIRASVIRDKAEHLFGTRLKAHKLEPLLKAFKGDKIQATRALYIAAQTMYNTGLYIKARGDVLFGSVVVEGQTVFLSGKVMDGVFHIGSGGIP